MADSFLYTYDLAVRALAYTKFGDILGLDALDPDPVKAINKSVVLCPKRIAKRELAEKRTELFLEFINIYRASTALSWDRQRTVVAMRGLVIQRPDGKIETIKASPVDLNYNMWFWSNSLDKINLCSERYMRWAFENPKMTLTYNDIYTLTPDLIFSPVIDESAIEDIYETGKIWVFRMPLKVEAWLPKSGGLSEKIEKIRLTFYDKDQVTNYLDIVVEDSNQDTELEAALRMFRTNLYGISYVDKIAGLFYVEQDRAEDFTADKKFIVEDSTGNDGMYTTVHASYVESLNMTYIQVLESIPDETADGNICMVENN